MPQIFTDASNGGWLYAVRPGRVQGLNVITRSDDSAVNIVVFKPPARRSMTYNISVMCDRDGFQLVSSRHFILLSTGCDFWVWILQVQILVRFLKLFAFFVSVFTFYFTFFINPLG